MAASRSSSLTVALQILRLKTFAGPAAGGCAVIAERAADAIVVAGARKQRVDLLHRGLRAAEPELEHAPHRRRQQLGIDSSFSIAFLSSFSRAALLLQPCQQLCELVDPGDGAAGDLGELGVDLGAAACAILRAASAKFRSTWKPRSLILRAQHPQACSDGNSARRTS